MFVHHMMTFDGWIVPSMRRKDTNRLIVRRNQLPVRQHLSLRSLSNHVSDISCIFRVCRHFEIKSHAGFWSCCLYYDLIRFLAGCYTMGVRQFLVLLGLVFLVFFGCLILVVVGLICHYHRQVIGRLVVSWGNKVIKIKSRRSILIDFLYTDVIAH